MRSTTQHGNKMSKSSDRSQLHRWPNELITRCNFLHRPVNAVAVRCLTGDGESKSEREERKERKMVGERD